eukprot:6390268-Alexandrium_andersonii.AAC.1
MASSVGPAPPPWMAARLSAAGHPWLARSQRPHRCAAMEAAHALGPAYLPTSHPLTSDDALA